MWSVEVSKGFESCYVAPPIGEWKEQLEENLGLELAKDAQGAIFSAAQDYTKQLSVLALDRGVGETWPDAFLTSELDRRSPIVMTGHQPTIFHGGIQYKYSVTSEFCSANQITGISVMLDTDEGLAGRCDLPIPPERDSAWAASGIREFTLATSQGSLFRSASVAVDVEERVEQIKLALKGCELSESIERCVQSLDAYVRLRGISMMDANAVVRRAAGHHRSLLEIPLSEICRLKPVRSWLNKIKHRGIEFAQRYNSQLAAYRKTNKIRGNANPFPDLRVDVDAAELPLWSVDLESGERFPVWNTASEYGPLLCFQPKSEYARNELTAIPDEHLLVPRGALISSLFRGLGCDLFVHGLGGESYDRFTDQWYQAEFEERLPNYAVASASQFLFARETLDEYDQLNDPTLIRKLSHAPESIIESSLFGDFLSDDERRQIEQMVTEKAQLIKAMQRQKAAGESAADAGKQLQALKERVQLHVEAVCQRKLGARSAPTEDQRRAISSRTYPWFMF